jgi:hypothetical protein
MAIAWHRRRPLDIADLERIPGLSNVDSRQNPGLLPVVLAALGCIAREDCWHEALQHHYSGESTRVLVTFTSIGYRVAENRALPTRRYCRNFPQKIWSTTSIGWFYGYWFRVLMLEITPGQAGYCVFRPNEATFL